LTGKGQSININKTKVMTSDGIACRILIQNEQLAQVNTFPCLGSLIMEDGECTTEFRTRLSRGQAIGASLQKIWKSHSPTEAVEIFRNINTALGTLVIHHWHPPKILQRSSQGNPSAGGVKHKRGSKI